MPALGWLLNLGFAGGVESTVVAGPHRVDLIAFTPAGATHQHFPTAGATLDRFTPAGAVLQHTQTEDT